MKKKLMLVVLTALALVPSTALAQQTVESGANANAAAILDYKVGTQLPNVPSGITGFVFPGFAQPTCGETRFYTPPIARRDAKGSFNSLDEIRRLAKSHGDLGKIRLSYSLARPNDVPPNKYGVKYLEYIPDLGHVVATAYAESVGPNQETPWALAVKVLKEKSNTRNVLILLTRCKAGRTEGTTFGTQGLASKAMNLLTAGAAGIAGLQTGSSTTLIREALTYMVLAFDDDIAPPPPAQSQTVATSAPPPAQLTQPVATSAPPVQTVRIEVVQVSAPTVKVPEPDNEEEACSVPPFVVYFGFDEDIVKDTYLSRAEGLAEWMATHRGCRFVIKGYTDRVGSDGYNAALGLRRSKAVYNILIGKDEGLRKQLQFASLGKNFPAAEYDTRNRRVVVQVAGATSAK